MPANLENSAVATGLEKVSFHFNPKERQKNAQTTTQLHSSHMLVKQCSKFFNLGFNNTWTVNFQAGFRKGRGTRDQIASIDWIIEKAREFQKNTYFCLIDPLNAWITTNCGKFWKRWEYQTTWPASWETYMQVRKQQLELDMEQQTGSRLGKKYIKAVYCHPAYLP